MEKKIRVDFEIMSLTVHSDRQRVRNKRVAEQVSKKEDNNEKMFEK